MYKTTPQDCLAMHKSSLTAMPNMVDLGDLNEAAILHNLRIRYNDGDDYNGTHVGTQIFTFIGPILISVNPYKGLPIFNKDYIQLYFNQTEDTPREQRLPPHAYEVTNCAFRNMLRGKKNQSMVISGESGAGKTEATKICLSFLAEIAGSVGGDDSGDARTPSQLLLDSSPIMEAFGNAKTVRNNNSSRFGKYMDLYFGEGEKICGGKINKYLLEKSRIVYQADGERNYHVFFHLFHLPKEWVDSYKLTKAEDYFYLQQGGCTTVEGIDDPEELALAREAFTRLLIPESEQKLLYGVVAASLHLGNVAFTDNGDDGAAEIKNQDEVDIVCELIGVDPAACAKTLTTRELKTGREITISVTPAMSNPMDQ